MVKRRKTIPISKLETIEGIKENPKTVQRPKIFMPVNALSDFSQYPLYEAGLFKGFLTYFLSLST